MKLTPNQQRLIKEFNEVNSAHILVVDVYKQALLHYSDKNLIARYPVSTSLYGVGQREDSYMTPAGLHFIHQILGKEGPEGQIYKNREPQGLISAEEMDSSADHILSRVLWLEGLEEGLNRGGDVDSKNRYIYIHGTNHENLVGKPVSLGCIRMRNSDIITLTDTFDLQGALCMIQG